MALVHVHLQHHTVTAHRQGGQRAVEYLKREGIFAPDGSRTSHDAEKAVGYPARTGKAVQDRQDLRYSETFNLPAWATSPADFFELSAQHEQVRGRWASSMQASLPRTLPFDEQKTLSRDFLQHAYPDRTLLMVIHEPTASDGQPQPHFHALWSERWNRDGVAREGAQFFQRYRPEHPELGGAPKEIFGKGDVQAPYRLREAWCAAVNLALERHGVDDFLDPRSRAARGLNREAVRITYAKDDHDKWEGRVVDERTPESREQERKLAQEWWQRYQQRMGLTVEMDRDAALRILTREIREPGARQQELAQERAQERHHESPRILGNVKSKIYHTPEHPNYGDIAPHNRITFATRAEAEALGYREARNKGMAPGELAAVARERRALRQEMAARGKHIEALTLAAHVERLREEQGRPIPPETQRKIQQLLAQGERAPRQGVRLRLREQDREDGLEIGR